MKTDSTIAGLLKSVRQQLGRCSESAALDAELLLCHCLGKPRSYLFTWPEQKPVAASLDCFSKLVEQRKSGIPVAYLSGEKEFWSLPLKVNPHVLIPRTETEQLVELGLTKLAGIRRPVILELGVGSGAIAIALAVERPDAEIIATDVSEQALEVARYNAGHHSVRNIRFLHSDWFSNAELKRFQGKFDLVLSNPPYIPEADPHLSGDIRHEPYRALASGTDGLHDIRIICVEALPFLKLSGWLIFEHGYDQGEACRDLLQANGFGEVRTVKDYAGNDRVSLGMKP